MGDVQLEETERGVPGTFQPTIRTYDRVPAIPEGGPGSLFQSATCNAAIYIYKNGSKGIGIASFVLALGTMYLFWAFALL